MSRPILCDNQCGNEASWLVTKIATGEVVALDDPCWAGWIQTMADALRPGPKEVPALEADAAQDGAGEAVAAGRPPRPKRRQAGRRSAPEALSSPESPFPDAAPDDS